MEINSTIETVPQTQLITEDVPAANADTAPVTSLQDTTQDPIIPRDPNNLKIQATKYHIALGWDSPGIEELERQLQVGLENELRKSTAESEAAKTSQAGREFVIQQAKTGQLVTTEQIKQAQNMLMLKPEFNPNQIFEYLYGHRYLQVIRNLSPTSREKLDVALVQSPEQTNQILDSFQNVVTKQEIAAKKLYDLQDKVRNSSWGHWLYEQGFDFLLGTWNTAHLYDKAVMGWNPKSWLPGQNLQLQRDKLWAKDTNTFQKEFNETIDKIEADHGPEQALRWGFAMMGMSSSEMANTNLKGVFDVAMLGWLAKTGVKLTGNLASIGIARAGLMGNATNNLAVGAHELGDAVTSSRIALIKHLSEGKSGEVPTLLKNILLPDYTSGSVDAIRAARIASGLDEAGFQVLMNLVAKPRLTMLEQQELNFALQQADQRAARAHGLPNDSFSARRIEWNPNTNTHEYVSTIRKKDGRAFESEHEAAAYASFNLKFGKHIVKRDHLDNLIGIETTGYQIVPKGAMYEIEVRAPVVYSDVVRGIPDIPTNRLDPKTPWFPFLQKLKSAPGQVSERNMINRQIIDHIPNEIHAFMQDWYKKYWGNLTTQETEAVTKIINIWEKNNISGEARGIVYTSLNDLDTAFMKAFNRLPSDSEARAYFAYHKAFAADWVMRDLLAKRDFIRQGVMQYQFTIRAGGKEPTQSGWVLGKAVDELPGASEAGRDYTVWVQRTNNASGEFYFAKDVPSEIYKKIRNGEFKVVQLAKPTENGLAAETGQNTPINFVVTKNFLSENIKGPVIDHNPGFHKIYANDGLVVQPNFGQGAKGVWSYSGDTALYATDRVSGPQFAASLEKLRLLMKTNPTKEKVEKLLLDEGLPEDYAYWVKHFKTLNLDAPIRYIPVNSSFFEAHAELYDKLQKEITKGGAFANMWDSPYNLAKNMDRAFMQKRSADISVIGNKGSSDKPLFEFGEANTLSPFEALQRGVDQITRNNYLGDLKTQVIEDFARQYWTVAANPLEAKNNPYGFFFNPVFQAPSKLNEKQLALVNAAKLANARHKQFMGMARSEDKWFSDVFIARMMEKGGAQRWIAEKVVPYFNDVREARAAMFHLNFGFANPLSFIQQFTGTVNAVAIAGPRSGLAGAFGAQATKAFEFMSPEARKALANRASKIGWKGQDLIDAWELGRSYYRVGQEATFKGENELMEIGIGKARRVIRWGDIMFNAGEGATRRTSWMAAAHEWLRKNPGAKLSEQNYGEIVNRANTLGTMMTRAFAGGLEEGIKSIPLWYTTYSRRLMEMYWGNRLTLPEKLRLFATHSVLYGVPGAVTAALPIWPWYDSWREAAIRRGMPVNAGWYQVAFEGWIAFLANMVGSEVNVSKTLSANPLMAPKDLYDVLFNNADGSNLAADLFGALGRSSQQFSGGITPFFRWVYDKISPEGGDYHLTGADALDLLRNIRTIDQATKLVYGINHHKYYSRRTDIPRADITSGEAIWLALGFQPQHIIDQGLIQKYNANYDKAHQYAMKKATEEFMKGIQAASRGDTETRNTHWRNTKFWAISGDLTDTDLAKALKRAYEIENVGRTIEIMRDFEKKSPNRTGGGLMDRILPTETYETHVKSPAAGNITKHLPMNQQR